jgi:O-antigen ligase
MGPWKAVHQPPVLAAEAPVSKPVISDALVYRNSPLRKFAFYSSLGLLFVLLTTLPEVIASLTGTNTYLLYIVGPPAVLGAVLAGGVQRTLQRRAAYYWIAFFAWMLLATPLSEWRGGSFSRVMDYGRFSMPMLFVVGGLAASWKEIRLMFYTIAAAGLLNLVTARLFMSTANTDNNRLALTAVGSSIGNSNDLAAQLLMVLPFLLFIALDPKRHLIFRIAVMGPISYGLWVILGTASRGALLALIATILVALSRGSMRQRIALLVGGLTLPIIILLALPQGTLNRLETLFGKQDAEADASAASRSYLFGQSVKFTFEHPIFGVGPDQFSNHEGHTRVLEGKVGSWHATHCTWTQVSSECGIPALIFYILGLGSASLLVSRAHRAARVEGNVEMANACFCYLLAMTGLIVAMTFLASAYRLYFPVLIGLGIAMSCVMNQQTSAASGGRPPRLA